ncbi:MAG TPA: L-threonylcarbamoyladenylate synthase [Ferruginibacter sp.]|nr:L-threonylcarbamoyladenylate synthase [Ferruginibacter sp.]
MPCVLRNATPIILMLLRIHPQNPQPRLIQQVADCLLQGGVVIYPTDSVYGIGCNIFEHKAIERIARIKNADPKKHLLTLLCSDLSHLSEYTKSINTPLYRMLKSYLPGPFTFILPASKMVPRFLQSKRSTIGLRVPDNEICRKMLQAVGHPVLSASLPGDRVEDYTDPEIIDEIFGDKVDFIIDGGIGGMTPSTVVDCSTDNWQVIRQGEGLFEE